MSFTVSVPYESGILHLTGAGPALLAHVGAQVAHEFGQAERVATVVQPRDRVGTSAMCAALPAALRTPGPRRRSRPS